MYSSSHDSIYRQQKIKARVSFATFKFAVWSLAADTDLASVERDCGIECGGLTL